MSEVRSVMTDPSSQESFNKTQLLEFYRLMVLARALDDGCQELHRDGHIGFHVSEHGNEALVVGATLALHANDWIFPSWRCTAAALSRDIAPQRILDNLLGNERDSSLGRQGPGTLGFREELIVPISAPIGTQFAQAVGLAQAATLKGDAICTLAIAGGDAAQSADFHTGLNFAGVANAPVVFLLRGDLDAGEAYGVNEIRVDADDVLAVYLAVKEAADSARNGEGPTLIVALSTESEDGLERFQTWLHEVGHLDHKLDGELAEAARLSIRAAMDDCASIGFPATSTLFDDVMATSSTTLDRQRDGMNRFGAEYGGGQDPDADFIAGT